MNILTLAPHLQPVDGLQQAQLAFCQGLARNGHRIDVLAAAGGANENRWRELAGSVQVPVDLSCTLRSPIGALGAIGRARRLGRSRPDVDVIYCHRIDHLNVGALLAQACGAALVFHAHDAPPGGGYERRTWSVLGGRRCDRLIVASEVMRRHWDSVGFDAVLVPYGIDTERFRPASESHRSQVRANFGILPSDVVVSYIGRVEPMKGVHVLFQALQGLRAPQGRALRLLVKGSPGRDVASRDAVQYRSLLKQLDRGTSTLWLEADRAVEDAYAASDLVVVPSTWTEPSGLVVAEAMASGVPVVASRVGGIPEQYPPGSDDLLVPPEDPAALRTAMERALSVRDRERTRRLRDWIAERRSIGASTALLEAEMAGALASRSGTS